MQGTMRTARSAVLALGLMFFGVLSAAAVTIPQSIESMTKESSDVVRGVVLSQQSQWNADHDYIYTTVKIRVAEAVKGSLAADREIEIFTPGGQVGDTGLFVEHAAVFTDGEEVVLFLGRSATFYEVTAWEQGKVTVENGTAVEKQMPLDTLINRIRAAQ